MSHGTLHGPDREGARRLPQYHTRAPIPIADEYDAGGRSGRGHNGEQLRPSTGCGVGGIMQFLVIIAFTAAAPVLGHNARSLTQRDPPA